MNIVNIVKIQGGLVSEGLGNQAFRFVGWILLLAETNAIEDSRTMKTNTGKQNQCLEQTTCGLMNNIKS